MSRQAELIEVMVEYEEKCPQRVQHFLKVYDFAKNIGELEKLEEHTQFILETTAIVHDIGIKPSLKKYNSSAGPHQEAEGPVVAHALLQKLGFEQPVIDRVCYLVGHHHSYADINGLDYQILVEADFLVNFFEEALSAEAIQNVYAKIFVTEAGKKMCRAMYLGQ
jgi:HD superfamily phosphodiesterase